MKTDFIVVWGNSMSRNNISDKENIINQVIEQIQNKLPDKQAILVSSFCRQFLDNVSVEDLRSRSIADLFGAILTQWELIKTRKPEECKLRVYNPHFEQDGWQSTHTILEFVQDDMPFLVDSMRMEIIRMGFTTHHIIHCGGMKVRRDASGNAIEILPFNSPIGEGIYAEAPIYIEIDRQTDKEILQQIHENLEHVLDDVRAAVEDWSKMRAKVRQALAELEKTNLPLDAEEIAETKDYLSWVENDHFTFLGYRYYKVIGVGENVALELDPESGLGVLRDTSHSRAFRSFSELPPAAKKVALSKSILIISKTNTKSTIHRPTYTDYIGVKVFNEKGELIGEHRFIGLYTSSAYNSNPKYIPFIRRKVAVIMRNSNLSPTGHAGKALLNVLETFPRDDLFQASTEELEELAIGILHLQERKRIRLFVRKDLYGRFMSCLVFVPRERFTTELAQKMETILMRDFNGLEISYTTRFSDSVLAQIHFVVRVDPKKPLQFSTHEVEQQLVKVGRAWIDELKEYLLDYFGEERGNKLFQKFTSAFSAGYIEAFNPRTAIYDIEHIESLNDQSPLAMSFYRPLEEPAGSLRFKLYRLNEAIPLSDALPIFENMGLRVIGERPYEVTLAGVNKAWINDFNVVSSQGIAVEIELIKDIFRDAFFHIWMKDAEDDTFNKLVLTARLGWREITIIRAYTKYLRQTGFTYSQSYIEETVVKYPVLAHLLVQLFTLKFQPNIVTDEDQLNEIEMTIKKELDNIIVLDEDRIMRSFLDMINATLRTNYFQINQSQLPKEYISFKFDPSKIPDLPLPLPMFEVWVYSPRLEGVHLRSSMVARGGLRWSDRREDFRTEVLGLMKAQNVKNAVIVPSGAKGGFVCKNLPTDGSREAIMEEVVYCYQTFIRGLLDLTDNIVNDEIVVPQYLKRYDQDDPYLVVAADKGTASFSDIANAVSEEYNFWLGDAFASGGSAGYDHKKMAITARGAWESVKRHFRELGRNTQTEDFTVVGIGDLAGDVFGNGMLLSEHIKLIGAFNHQHIFIDPDPNPAMSFEERKRIFNLPRSSWEDYNSELISKGGGVFRRTAKAIKLTPEVKKLLNIKKDFIVPNELIRSLLTAEVDLLWNGGIGTFVKSKEEDHAEVGDRTNDALRVNGSQLRCRVVGEGGNLGFTQLGRIEFALNGGHIFTDFIDNSGGVDCSDHEVNIKILLNTIVRNGDMTYKQRNQLLAEMKDEVAELVLKNNYLQTQAISLVAERAPRALDLHNQIIEEMAHKGQINTALEFLPNAQELMERKALGRGLTRPELAILFAYSKSLLKAEILASDIPEDPYLSAALVHAFPEPLRVKYREAMQHHRLSREIIATLLSNAMINEMGFTFVTQLHNETGATVSEIVRAYTIIRNIFKLVQIHKEIEKLDYQVSTAVQSEMVYSISRLIRRATRWLLRNRRMQIDITNTCEHFTPSIEKLFSIIDKVLVGSEKEYFETKKQYYMDANVPEDLAKIISSVRGMISALDIIDAADLMKFNLEEVARMYFSIGEYLELAWFRGAINNQTVDNKWDGFAKEACRDDLDWQQRGLTDAILQTNGSNSDVMKKIDIWSETHKHLVDRWQLMLSSLRSSSSLNFVMFTVAGRELMDLTQASKYTVEQQKKVVEAGQKKSSKNKLSDKTGTENS